MARKCSTCQHVKRAEIDRRLAAGEPGNQIAHDYDLNPSSLHRHRSNCVGLSSSNKIMKEVFARHRGRRLPSQQRRPQHRLFRTAGADRPDRQSGRTARLASDRAVRPELNPTNIGQPVETCRIRAARRSTHRGCPNQCQSRPPADRRSRDCKIRSRTRNQSADRASATRG
jgi:hypothetical protein